MAMSAQSNRSIGAIDARASDLQHVEKARIAATPATREPTAADMILTQAHLLHKVLAEIEQRAENVVSRLGYPTGQNEATGRDARPSRGGVLGEIADTLDNTEPRLRRIIGHLDLISRQV